MPQPAFDHFTTHDGLSIAYRVSGRGRPVVLIHGITATSTASFAAHYALDGSGQMKATAGRRWKAPCSMPGSRW